MLCLQAAGDVLEIAVGTGLNLSYYKWSVISSYTGIDLSPGMLQQAQQRAAALKLMPQASPPQEQFLPPSTSAPSAASVIPAPADAGSQPSASIASASSSSSDTRGLQLLEANAAQLPFPDASFDSIVSTFSLCVIDRPLEALQEMARVVRPGGRVLLLEHARSDQGLLAAYQVRGRRGRCSQASGYCHTHTSYSVVW
jgi:ubiquinone/menaquinone biosynthesis C-methylase UbiE